MSVNRELYLPSEFSPQSTHELYLNASEIPRLNLDELIARINQFHQLGYVSIAGILVRSWQTDVTTALSMHELAANHLRKGALIGPYCFSYGIAVPGIKLYKLQ